MFASSAFSPGDRPDLPVYAAAMDAKQSTPPGGELALVVRITGVRPTRGPVDCYTHAISMQDYARGSPIAGLPTTDLKLADLAERILLKGGLAVVRGRYAPDCQPTKKGEATLRLELTGLSPTVRATDLVSAMPEQIAAARALIERLRLTPGALEQHILSELAWIHQIATQSLTPRYLRFVRLVLLQAVSQGMVGPGSNPRLSLSFISEPGQGKGVLTRYAESLAPIAPHAQPGLITPAGLAVRIEQQKGEGWVSRPGALARAHGGIGVIDDLHRLPKSQVTLLESLIMGAAEEGILKPTKAAHTPYIAECGVHLNGNYRHLIEEKDCPKGPRARLSDIGTPLDEYSRIDIVGALCIGDEIDELALELATQKVLERTEAEKAEAEAREHGLKVLVAVLRDDIPQVDLAPVEPQVRGLVGQVQTIVKEQAARLSPREEGLFEPGALSLRMARTVRKLLGSSARLDGRSVASEKDVEWAAEALAFKLEVNHWVCGTGPAVVPLPGLLQQYRRAQAQAEMRGERILETFGGTQATAEEVAAGMGCGVKTAQRTLRNLCLAAHLGRYHIPTPLDHEKMQEEAERRGEELVPPPLPEVEETEEDRQADEAPHRFYDSLPRIPGAYRPLVRAYEEVGEEPGEQHKKDGLARTLVLLATARVLTDQEQFRALDLAGVLPGDVLNDPEAAENSGLAMDFKQHLLSLPEEDRCGLGLAMYSSVLTLPDQGQMLRAALQREDLSLPIRRHIESALARRQFLRERRYNVRLQL